jgi:hypothetical protein
VGRWGRDWFSFRELRVFGSLQELTTQTHQHWLPLRTATQEKAEVSSKKGWWQQESSEMSRGDSITLRQTREQLLVKLEWELFRGMEVQSWEGMDGRVGTCFEH